MRNGFSCRISTYFLRINYYILIKIIFKIKKQMILAYSVVYNEKLSTKVEVHLDD